MARPAGQVQHHPTLATGKVQIERDVFGEMGGFDIVDVRNRFVLIQHSSGGDELPVLERAGLAVGTASPAAPP